MTHCLDRVPQLCAPETFIAWCGVANSILAKPLPEPGEEGEPAGMPVGLEQRQRCVVCVGGDGGGGARPAQWFWAGAAYKRCCPGIIMMTHLPPLAVLLIDCVGCMRRLQVDLVAR